MTIHCHRSAERAVSLARASRWPRRSREERYDFLGRPDFNGRLGHSPDDARRLILSDGSPAQPRKFNSPLHRHEAFRSRERRHRAWASSRAALLKKTSTEGRYEILPGLDRIMQAAIFAQYQMVVGSGEQDFAQGQVGGLRWRAVTGRSACSESHCPSPAANAASTC